MEQAGEAGGPDANRYLPALAKNRGRQLLLRDVDHDALAQLDGGEVRQIAIERDLVVRAAVRVVKNGAWHATTRFLPQIFDAVEDPHVLRLCHHRGFVCPAAFHRTSHDSRSCDTRRPGRWPRPSTRAPARGSATRPS